MTRDSGKETEARHPDSIIVTRYSDDGKTKTEYVYHRDGDRRAEKPQYQSDSGDIFSRGINRLDKKLGDYSGRMRLAERIPFICAKFLITLVVFTVMVFFTRLKTGVFEIVLVVTGFLIFAIIPFPVLVANIGALRKEQKNRRDQKRHTMYR